MERTIGTTKWSFWGLFKYAIDGFASFTVSPLRWLSALGTIISSFAFIYIIITLVQTLIFGITVEGYVTTLCTVLFLGGIIELSIGILGEYISRIYLESKHRPIFLVKDTNIGSDNKEDNKDDIKKSAKNSEDKPKNNIKTEKIQQISKAVEKAIDKEDSGYEPMEDEKMEDVKEEPEKVEYDLSYFE